MFEHIQTVSELNAARHAAGVPLMAALNAGKITDAEWQTKSDTLSDAYEKRIQEIWDSDQRVRDTVAIAAARAIGFSPDQYMPAIHFFATMKTYSNLKLAGLPVKGPEVDEAIDDINHVSEVLSDASAAYERIQK